MKLDIIQEEKGKLKQKIFVTQKKLKNDRNILRKNCFKNASLFQMDFVEDYLLKPDRNETFKLCKLM